MSFSAVATVSAVKRISSHALMQVLPAICGVLPICGASLNWETEIPPITSPRQRAPAFYCRRAGGVYHGTFLRWLLAYG